MLLATLGCWSPRCFLSCQVPIYIYICYYVALSNAQQRTEGESMEIPNPSTKSRRDFFVFFSSARLLSSFHLSSFPDADALTIDNAALTHDLWRTRTPSIAVFLLTLSIHHAPRLLLVVVVVVVVVVARSSSSRNWQSACVCHDAPNI